jgi:hypothetical protein
MASRPKTTTGTSEDISFPDDLRSADLSLFLFGKAEHDPARLWR